MKAHIPVCQTCVEIAHDLFTSDDLHDSLCECVTEMSEILDITDVKTIHTKIRDLLMIPNNPNTHNHVKINGKDVPDDEWFEFEGEDDDVEE